MYCVLAYPDLFPENGIYIDTQTYTHMYAHIHTYTHTYISLHTHIFLYTHTYTHTTMEKNKTEKRNNDVCMVKRIVILNKVAREGISEKV